MRKHQDKRRTHDDAIREHDLCTTTAPPGVLREAEQARLLRATRPTPDGGERAFQHFIWWVGGALLT
jgi:hypothetical protein